MDKMKEELDQALKDWEDLAAEYSVSLPQNLTV